MTSEDRALTVLLLLAGVLLCLVAYFGHANDAEHARLMHQCLADGHAPSECIHMLRPAGQ